MTLLSVRNLCSKLYTFRQQEKERNHPKVHVCNKTGSRVIFLHFKISSRPSATSELTVLLWSATAIQIRIFEINQ